MEYPGQQVGAEKAGGSRRTWKAVWWVWLGALLFSGCPRSGLKQGVFQKPGLRYAVGKLEGNWRQLDLSENDLAFYNSTFGAVIQANSTCRRDYEDASLGTLTSHLFNGLTARRVHHRERRTIDRRAALYTELTAKLDGVTVRAALLVVKKNECVFDFSYIARPWNFGSGLGQFYRFVYGFRVLP